MRKISLILALIAFGAVGSFAQGSLGKGGKQLNAGIGFSSWGTPVYVGLDFGVHDAITVGPKLSYRKHTENYLGFKFSQTLTVLAFNGNYHFNQLLNLPGPWDLYAGLTLGYYIWSDVKWSDGTTTVTGFGGEASGVGLDAQLGIRYFFSDNFGMNLELGGGTASGGNFGITYKF